jgi:hypothetical protein
MLIFTLNFQVHHKQVRIGFTRISSVHPDTRTGDDSPVFFTAYFQGRKKFYFTKFQNFDSDFVEFNEVQLFSNTGTQHPAEKFLETQKCYYF